MKKAKFQNKDYSIPSFCKVILRYLSFIVVLTCVGLSVGFGCYHGLKYDYYSVGNSIESNLFLTEANTETEKVVQFLTSNQSMREFAAGLEQSGISVGGRALEEEEISDGLSVTGLAEIGTYFQLEIVYASKTSENIVSVSNCLTETALAMLNEAKYPDMAFAISSPLASEYEVTTITSSSYLVLPTITFCFLSFILAFFLDLTDDTIYDLEDVSASFLIEQISVLSFDKISKARIQDQFPHQTLLVESEVKKLLVANGISIPVYSIDEIESNGAIPVPVTTILILQGVSTHTFLNDVTNSPSLASFDSVVFVKNKKLSLMFPVSRRLKSWFASRK